jgi:asparagine synthase (glutamine-hydrolysing)
MSVQFGRWNLEGTVPASEYIEKVNRTLAPYGPDSNETYSQDGVKILYRSFCTTKESHGEKQPHVLSSGMVLTWDGRLDNRAELIGELQDAITLNSTDVEIVAGAFERWSEKCLCKLVGDWALSIWNPRERSLLLAKDPIGTRHLFYSFEKDHVTWSTILDPLVLFAGKTFMICEEYIANWLTNQFPAGHLTPYVGIQAVPPSCSVLLRQAKSGTKDTITKYWEFDPDTRIRYRTDAEYEEHFRFAFATAVQRRLRSDRPILAELSGGIDSSSIVCMADSIMGVGTQDGVRNSSLTTSPVECPRLDTISWFGDFHADLESDTNEFHWISKVEQKRGRAGFHINHNDLKPTESRSPRPFMSAFDRSGFASTPAPRHLSSFFKLYATHVASQGHRVTFSGVGGDHVTGRDATPMPELQTLLVRGHLFALARQLNAWAITTNKARIPLLWEAVRDFFPRGKVTTQLVTASWLHSEFVHRNHAALCDCRTRIKFLRRLPSFQYNLAGLDAERRLAAYWTPNPALLREVRYPYLDRDFLRFMYAIPREQVVRAGQHRFLMRRALVGIVPNELLNRKRNAFVLRESETDNSKLAGVLGSMDIGQQMLSSSIGIVDPGRFSEALLNVKSTEGSVMHMLIQTLKVEAWLRHLATHGVLSEPRTTDNHVPTLPLRAEAPPYLLNTTVQLSAADKFNSTMERR